MGPCDGWHEGGQYTAEYPSTHTAEYLHKCFQQKVCPFYRGQLLQIIGTIWSHQTADLPPFCSSQDKLTDRHLRQIVS